ncbi:hypothetical protein, partial [Marinobacter xestospongiae]|uniref:hypothetical protein n=1 Tax=Marinobacter xestospongiae TaxID=994319 RepID=UPI002003F3F5
TDHLEFVLLWGGLFEHGAASGKSLTQLQQTPAAMARVCQQSEPGQSPGNAMFQHAREQRPEIRLVLVPLRERLP